MSKSLIYAANTAAQALVVNDVVNFGSAVRKYGCNCKMSGGNVIVAGSGYYDVETNITFTAGGAGTAVFNVYKDGTIIPGATTSLTVASGDVASCVIPTTVRQACNCESVITVVITGIAATVNNAAIRVVKA